MKILIPQSGGGVTVVIPAPGFTAEEVVEMRGFETYEIINDVDLPSDDTFRDSWEWAGVGQPITVDLEKARGIALGYIRNIAIAAATSANAKELVDEYSPYSASAVKDAYTECKSDIQTAGNVSAIKTCLVNFSTTYEVGN